MIYISKPKKIFIYVNTQKKTAERIKAETGCTALINGGLYDMATFTPVCHLKAAGTILASDKYKYWGYAWNENDLILTQDYTDYQNYICCVCLVRDGVSEELHYNSDLGGSRPRTALGRFSDGRVWMYCGGSLTPEELQQIALDANLESTIMLDGGGSTQGIFPGGQVSSARTVHNYICVWDDAKDDGENVKTICLDPGHGGNETSNGSPDGTYKEHEFTLDMALRVKPLLESRGVKVILTRDENETVSLSGRCKIANDAKADLFVSLHSNASGSDWSEASGLTVWTYSDGATAERNIAAQLLLTRMGEVGVKLFGSQLYHKGFTVLSQTNMPAYLIEYGFHTSKADVVLLKSSIYRQKMAEATAKAILDYFGIAWTDAPQTTVIYRVQVGAFKNKAYAEALQKRLIAEGYDTIIDAEEK